MRHYIHLIHELDGNVPGKQIATVKGKRNFRKWVMKRYFEDSGAPVCFCLEGDEGGPFYKVIPFPIMQGKNRGKDRVVFMKIESGPGISDENRNL